jgi:hypothetical protein
MYLAGILALCALLHGPAFGHVGSGASSFALEPSPSSTQVATQDPAKPDQQPQVTPQEPAKPDASQEQKVEEPQPPQVTPNPPTPETHTNPQKGAPTPKPTTPPKKRPVRHKRTRSTNPDSTRKVIRKGGTTEPTTQLGAGMTDEQAARQRASTSQLLASTDASLQKLSSRSLTRDEQDTVTQIRKFIEQVKAADAAGDLQRAHKLALKAHLLSDALTKP